MLGNYLISATVEWILSMCKNRPINLRGNTCTLQSREILVKEALRNGQVMNGPIVTSTALSKYGTFNKASSIFLCQNVKPLSSKPSLCTHALGLNLRLSQNSTGMDVPGFELHHWPSLSDFGFWPQLHSCLHIFVCTFVSKSWQGRTVLDTLGDRKQAPPIIFGLPN